MVLSNGKIDQGRENILPCERFHLEGNFLCTKWPLRDNVEWNSYEIRVGLHGGENWDQEHSWRASQVIFWIHWALLTHTETPSSWGPTVGPTTSPTDDESQMLVDNTWVNADRSLQLNHNGDFPPNSGNLVFIQCLVFGSFQSLKYRCPCQYHGPFPKLSVLDTYFWSRVVQRSETWENPFSAEPLRHLRCSIYLRLSKKFSPWFKS